MTEHIGHSNFGDLHAVIQWQDQWYCLPFFVLEDLLSELVRNHTEGRKELGAWLNTWKSTWRQQPIEVLKDILREEMAGMGAYRLFT